MYNSVSNRFASLFATQNATWITFYHKQFPPFMRQFNNKTFAVCFDSAFICGKISFLAIKRTHSKFGGSQCALLLIHWSSVCQLHDTRFGKCVQNVSTELYTFHEVHTESETVQCMNDTEFGAIRRSVSVCRYLVLSSLLSNARSLIRLLSTFLSLVWCFPLSYAEFYPMHQRACCLHTNSTTMRNTSGISMFIVQRVLSSSICTTNDK